MEADLPLLLPPEMACSLSPSSEHGHAVSEHSNDRTVRRQSDAVRFARRTRATYLLVSVLYETRVGPRSVHKPVRDRVMDHLRGRLHRHPIEDSRSSSGSSAVPSRSGPRPSLHPSCTAPRTPDRSACYGEGPPTAPPGPLRGQSRARTRRFCRFSRNVQRSVCYNWRVTYDSKAARDPHQPRRLQWLRPL